MNDEITATMTFDEPTMLDGYIWHQRRSSGSQWLLYLAILLVGASAVIEMTHLHRFQMVWQCWLLIGVTVLIPAIRLLGKTIYLRNLKSAPSFGETAEYTFADEGFTTRHAAGDGKFKWAFCMKTVTAPTGVMIYYSNRSFNWLPKTAFTSEADYTRFLELIAAKTKHSKIG